MNKKVILMILDGWGKSPDPKVSAIDNANTPFIDSLYLRHILVPVYVPMVYMLVCLKDKWEIVK